MRITNSDSIRAKGTQRTSKDVYAGLRFFVEIEGVQVAGFSECSGLSVETEVFEYAEGGWNTSTYKMPVRTKFSNVTLKRGIDPGQDLHRWYSESLDGIPNKRKNVTIIVYKPDGKVAKRWALREAFPVKWAGPDLRADAGSTAIETLEIAHHGLSELSP